MMGIPGAVPAAQISARIPGDPATETLEVGDSGVYHITVHELSVGEVRAWLTEMASQVQRDPLHALAFEDIGLDELARMTDWTVEHLERFAPSQLAEVLRVARRLNPDFFRIRGVLIAAASPATQTAPQNPPQPAEADARSE
jgi:hypothetical protein